MKPKMARGDGSGQAGDLLTCQAKISSIERDLGLSDVQYQTSVSILFVGYILYVLPFTLLMMSKKKSVMSLTKTRVRDMASSN